MRKYVFLWSILTAILVYEYAALSFQPQLSILKSCQNRGLIAASVEFSTKPGRTLSLWLGWVGFSLMVLMNIYSMRKRFDFLFHFGRLSSWLNFHIFCGILGPTLIFFHSGLKVRGVVAIAFWSMVISLVSGIIGRYLYVRLASHREEYEALSNGALYRLEGLLKKMPIQIQPDQKLRVLNYCLNYVGADIDDSAKNPFVFLYSSLAGDFRLAFSDMPSPASWPVGSKSLLLQYAINKRKAQSIAPFQILMGYWHAFHLPFAIFMYIAAVIHIASSLIFLRS